MVIVGGGPAGLTAAIYCVRRKLKAVVLERMTLGGQMQLASEIGNWPGDTLISGVELSKRMEEHAKSLGAEFIYDEAVSMDLQGGEKTITLRDKKITSSAVILATGGQHRKLKVKGEEDYVGKGVSYCATCDGPFFKGRKVVVVGGGNMAVEDALYLNTLASKTYLVSDKLTAEEVLLERLESSGVEAVSDSVVEILGDEFLNSVALKSGETLDVEGVFIAAGSVPSAEVASQAGVELDDKGFIKVNRDMATNLPGVYAAGDVTGGIPQIAKAVGEACVAALRAYQHVKNQ